MICNVMGKYAASSMTRRRANLACATIAIALLTVPPACTSTRGCEKGCEHVHELIRIDLESQPRPPDEKQRMLEAHELGKKDRIALCMDGCTRGELDATCLRTIRHFGQLPTCRRK